jgi:hypothetical protein
VKIFQKPNKSLVIAILSFLVYGFTHGLISDTALVIALTSAIFWGTVEVVDGTNWFRKTLGWSGVIMAAIYMHIGIHY